MPRATADRAALRAIIAVARNRLDEAQRWSERALAADPDFAPAHIAASYVRQANGDLTGALRFAQDAVRIDALFEGRLTLSIGLRQN